MNYYLLIIGLVLVILELLIPGFFIAAVGIAAIITSLFTYFEMSIAAYIFIFALSLLLSFLGITKLQKSLQKNSQKSNMEAVFGKEATITEAIDNQNLRCKFDGEDWKAICSEAEPISVGEKVVIENVSGVTLTVRRKK